ncbi:MAG TPA: 7TM diverse intracellular signaling domain-containing protein, partial [Chitinophagaceae bacterium]|nr:7TM diverse intracellular signaling domain-containing protein [Chitinophagaceae bacterium]
MTRLYRSFIFLTMSLMLLGSKAYTQDSLQQQFTDISKISLVRQLSKTINSTYTDKNIELAKEYAQLKFSPGIKHKGTVPNEYVTRKLALQFNISNSADSTVSVYFFPGFYYSRIDLYQKTATGLVNIPSVLPSNEDSIGYRLISLGGHDSATIIAHLSFVKTYINTIRPRLIHKDHIDSFLAQVRSSHNNDNLVTYVFCGLLLMMILFSFSNFLQGANREFFYYSLYAFLLGSMLFTKATYDFQTTHITFFLEAYLDFILQGLGIIFYMIFMQKFLNTRQNHPFLFKFYNAGIIMLAVTLLLYSYLHFFTDNFSLENTVENASKLLLLLMVLIFLVYSIRNWKDRLMRYLFWGNLCLFLFSVISQLSVMMEQLFKDLPGVFSSALFYYEIGLFLELVFFLAGLNHKNRRSIIQRTKETETLKAQNLMQQYEKEIAVFKAQQAERERISADMHDELGSGMTAIRLMSEIARNKMKENTPVEIHKISQSADEVLNKMNAIIWSMNSGNDTLDNLLSYIRSYSLEYLDNTNIDCKV